MDPGLLVAAHLTREMVIAGANVLTALLQQGLPIKHAYWQLLDQKKWRFMVVSPLVGTLGPQDVYRTIYAVLESMPRDVLALELDDITAMDSLAPDFAIPDEARSTGEKGFAGGCKDIDGKFHGETYVYA